MMYTTYPKSNPGHLVAYLSKHVEEVPFWLSKSLFARGPGKLPWISLPAIKEIKRFAKPGKTVFEFGTG